MKFPLLGKVVAVGAFALGLTMVLARIGFLVDERAERQQEAERSVQQSQAGAQTVLGPLLQRQCAEEWDSTVGEGKDKKKVVEKREFLLQATPDNLRITSALNSEPRYRGLFKVNGYVGRFALDADWANAQAMRPVAERADGRLKCQPAVLLLALGDVRGVRQAKAVVQGTEFAVQPGTQHAEYKQGFHVTLPAPWPLADDKAAVTARIELELVGTARLAVVPAANATTWKLSSDWPHPSFGGRFLPTDRSISDAGFEAQWKVSSLASAAPKQVLDDAAICDLSNTPRGFDDDQRYAVAAAAEASGAKGCVDTLAVAFIDPVNPYMLSDRATKYGLLFIALTFVAVGLVEVLGKGRVRRVHPVQYALVGLALTLFFLLLLSLSEHFAFWVAYAAASTACVTLLGSYTAHMLGQRKAGVLFGAAMALLYGLMYVLLQREQTALVIGSVGLFTAVAAVMWLTRRVDWYRLFEDARGTPDDSKLAG
ncbi:cell envelope integrity protein CreD [Ideonella paludis]|uniref:Cell envelope integrity protein CreD n=1 Tax=Ideonella paludis TaxID=1233411 RepID=A0ABS5DSQ7_9BURK|nr:cell envelope integrity protein CreD [Ideonella paludis]MBQ0934178.1 cell envelope integrity protein CreD [Ideonella paludis]